MLVYATPAQLATWTGQPEPDNAVVLLREASILVADACRCDVYDTIPSGLPSDPDLVEAMRDATCAQAEAWAASGDNPIKGPGGQEPRLTVTAIDGASLSYDTYLTAPDRARALTTLCASGLRILRLAGLASAAVRS